MVGRRFEPAGCICTAAMPLRNGPSGTAGLKRQINITTEFASRTISPVPDISRYALEG